MIDYAASLSKNSKGVLATQDGQGVRTRVFDCLFTEGNKAFFCTSSEKSVYAQLQANPNVSFCTYPANFNPVMSIMGKAVFVDDLAVKTRAFDEKPMLKGRFGAPDSPAFKVFFVDIAEVTTFSIAEGTKSYMLQAPHK